MESDRWHGKPWLCVGSRMLCWALLDWAVLGCLLLGGLSGSVSASGQVEGTTSSAPAESSIEAGLVLPEGKRPIEVQASFWLLSVNSIDSETESFQVSGTLTLVWRDSRQAFDPAVVGVPEKVYQGSYQFNELAPAWYPQVVLANEFGLMDKRATLLRIQPDGTSTLVESFTCAARVKLNLRNLPFDSQTLDLRFKVFGFGIEEAVLVCSPTSVQADMRDIRVPQWDIASFASRIEIEGNGRESASAYVVSIVAHRNSLFMMRTIILPLMFCVLLSMSVFWMEGNQLGDRMNVSFFGILTSVAYYIVISDLLPQISYVTLIHMFLNLSLLTMFGTAIVNLVVATRDRNGKPSQWIDARCRWLFPLVYLGLIAIGCFLMLVVL